MNAITELDLGPLSSCVDLRALDIAGNQLDSIDLSPLSECVALEELYLHSNHPQENDFSELNLTPLFSCPELEDLGVPDSCELFADSSLKKKKEKPFALDELIEDGRISWSE